MIKETYSWEQVDQFTDFAKYLDQFVLLVFFVCICTRKGLEYARFADALNADHALWKRSWGERITAILTVRMTSLSSTSTRFSTGYAQERTEPEPEPELGGAGGVERVAGVSRPASPGYTQSLLPRGSASGLHGSE